MIPYLLYHNYAMFIIQCLLYGIFCMKFCERFIEIDSMSCPPFIKVPQTYNFFLPDSKRFYLLKPKAKLPNFELFVDII